MQEIKRLEDMFTVPKEKLKEITAHFQSELTRGDAPVHYIECLRPNYI